MSGRKRANAHGHALRAPDESYLFDDDEASPQDEAPPGAAASSLASTLLGAARMGAGLLLVVGTSLGVAYGVHHYALTSPRFALADVSLSGGQRVSPERARVQGGINLGQNLFALDTGRIEHELLENPWIAEARVTRDLPRALRIEIVERTPAALAVIGERLYLVTPAGEPFKELEAGDPADFPLITGASIGELSRDRKREIERIALGLEVLEQYRRLPIAKAEPAQEVHLADSGDVSLTVGRGGITLELGKDQLRRKLLMAEQVVAELGRKGRAPGIVFLDNQAHPERVVVRMR